MTSPIVQETNIEKILESHLWPEIRLIEAEMVRLQQRLNEFAERRNKLENIAQAAGISPTTED